MNNNYLHIVSFDIPYPPDYGGVIDVFYKIKYLYEAGYKIILHCFQYNERKITDELSKYCEKIYVYPRNTSLLKHFSLLPYTVTSRKLNALLNNLLQDNYPILFETLHTTSFISHSQLKNRKKILRLSNIEHHYYYHLFLVEKNFLKKIYFLIESIKLYFYEKPVFQAADILLPVTTTDADYIKKYYSKVNIALLPSFHPFNDLSISKGKGDYLLYHGNLSIAENYKAAEFLINKIASKIHYPIIIAGKNPPKFLYKKINKYPHIQIVANPDENEMKQLIQKAHIVWLYTHQATGLKLKLLHSLYAAKFIICNNKMLHGTNIAANESLYIKNAPQEIIQTIENLKSKEFDDTAILQRQELIKNFDNRKNIQHLLQILQ